MKKNTFIFYFLMLLTFGFYSQAQQKEVTISVDTLSNKIYMLTGRGGNIGIFVGQENVYMIDDQFANISDKIEATIKTLTNKPISYLVNTHMHGDHTGGNANFNSDNTTLVAQQNVRKRLTENGLKNLEANKITKEEYKKTLPEVTFAEEITFFEDDETVMLIHVHNAHTDGDTMVYFVNDNVLHMGDTYFSGRYPFIDLKSGGSIEGYIKAQKKALMVIDEETKIIPGHGKFSNTKELESYVKVLEELRDNVKDAIEAGKSLEEVKADNSLTSKYDDPYGTGFINPERMRETLYLSLSKN